MNNTILKVPKTGSLHQSDLLNLALFSFGSFLNAASYSSIAPIVLSIFLFSLLFIFLYIPSIGGFWERRIFSRVFTIAFLMSGVSAVFVNQLLDPFQIFSDAGRFFEKASAEPERYLSLLELYLLLMEDRFVHEI